MSKKLLEAQLRVILREYREKYGKSQDFIASRHKDSYGNWSGVVDMAELELLHAQIDKLTIKSILELKEETNHDPR